MPRADAMVAFPHSRVARIAASVVVAVGFVSSAGLYAGAGQTQAADVTALIQADLFGTTEIPYVAISSDGSSVAYVTARDDYARNAHETNIFLVTPGSGAAPRAITTDGKATYPAFLGNDILFLDSTGSATELMRYHSASGATEKLTTAPDGVSSFQISPDGKRVALIGIDAEYKAAQKPVDITTGYVVDKFSFLGRQLLTDPTLAQQYSPSALYLLSTQTGKLDQLTRDQDITHVRWLGDSSTVVIEAEDAPFTEGKSHSIEALNVATGTLRRYRSPAVWDSTDLLNVFPDGRALVGLSDYEHAAWDPENVVLLSLHDARWTPISPSRLPAQDGCYACSAFPQDDGSILLAYKAAGNSLLYRIGSGARDVATVLGFKSGYSASFAFAKNGAVAFVHQDTDHPPEVYVAASPASPSHVITSVNADAPKWDGFRIQRVHWRAPDKTVVEGWLYIPKTTRPYPLITMIHGGPVFPILDRFTQYSTDYWSDNLRIWPYPFRALATMGYGVFIPNYRLTDSYGARFRHPAHAFATPTADVISGITAMIRLHGADRHRLAILGHSHGGILGPYIVAHMPKFFAAASFAEGGGSFLTIYAQQPGWLNLHVHERYNDVRGSPTDFLSDYIAISAPFTIAKARTPLFLEAGALSGALEELDYLTPVWRAGVPHEMIIYRNTGHNIMDVSLRLESAQRNVDWLDYWVRGVTPKSQFSADELMRWVSMRQSERTAPR